MVVLLAIPIFLFDCIVAVRRHGQAQMVACRFIHNGGHKTVDADLVYNLFAAVRRPLCIQRDIPRNRCGEVKSIDETLLFIPAAEIPSACGGIGRLCRRMIIRHILRSWRSPVTKNVKLYGIFNIFPIRRNCNIQCATCRECVKAVIKQHAQICGRKLTIVIRVTAI